MCAVVIDSDAVQMPAGGWEIEMNVTERTQLVPYIKGPLAGSESEMGVMAGVWGNVIVGNMAPKKKRRKN